MTNRAKFFYNGILLTAVGLSVRTVGLIFGAFVSRAVGAEGTGLYTLIMTVYSFAVTFATSGISLTVTRLVAAAIGEGRGGSVGGILRGAMLYALVFSFSASAVLFFGAGIFAERIIFDSRSVISLRILSFSLVPAAMSAVFSGYFVGIKKISCNAAVQVVTQFVKISLTVLLVVKAAERGTEAAVAALCIGISIAEAAAFLLMLLQFLTDRLRRERSVGSLEMKPVLGMALPLAFSAYIRSGLLTLEHILIPKRLSDGGSDSSEALSSYGTLHGMALPLVLYPMSPLSSFSGLLVPEFAENGGGESRMRRITSEVMNNTLAYATAIAVFLYVFSEELGYIIYNSYEAGIYIALIAPIVPIMYLDHVTDSMLKGIGEHVYSMWVNISDSFLSIILVWFLIPKLGIGGYALVIIIMEAYNFALSLIRLRKRISFSLSSVRALILPAVSAFFATHLSKKLFVMNGTVTTPIWLVLKIVFAASIFLGSFMILTKVHTRVKKTRVKTDG
ncbi:MAG: oligosaccharide flippase family protein [Clostridia bacterium]|nr:oligosaccharide flippase family protein [Clostridia bacterium]